jgi:hypothetical protein
MDTCHSDTGREEGMATEGMEVKFMEINKNRG